MTAEELIARLKAAAPGDFVTLSSEDAAMCAEIMRRRIPIIINPIVCAECGAKCEDER